MVLRANYGSWGRICAAFGWRKETNLTTAQLLPGLTCSSASKPCSECSNRTPGTMSVSTERLLPALASPPRHACAEAEGLAPRNVAVDRMPSPESSRIPCPHPLFLPSRRCSSLAGLCLWTERLFPSVSKHRLRSEGVASFLAFSAAARRRSLRARTMDLRAGCRRGRCQNPFDIWCASTNFWCNCNFSPCLYFCGMVRLPSKLEVTDCFLARMCVWT